MKIGYTVYDYGEHHLKLAARLGFDCFEAWADRGTVLDVEKMTDDDYKRLAEEQEKYGVSIDSVVCAANHLEANDAKRKDNNALFMKVIKNARKYGAEFVMTNAWADPNLSPEGNIPRYKEVFSEYARAAEAEGVRIVLENCPHTTEYPVTIGNISYSPVIWDMMFDAVPSRAIGIEYDPSHMVWQQIDYVGAIRNYGDRIYACHAKDTEINYKWLGRSGINGPTDKESTWHNGWWRYRMPGLGQIDWSAIFRALADVNYKGPMFIEHEDPIFSGDRYEEGLWMGLRYLRSMAPPNPKQMGL